MVVVIIGVLVMIDHRVKIEDGFYESIDLEIRRYKNFGNTATSHSEIIQHINSLYNKYENFHQQSFLKLNFVYLNL